MCVCLCASINRSNRNGVLNFSIDIKYALHCMASHGVCQIIWCWCVKLECEKQSYNFEQLSKTSFFSPSYCMRFGLGVFDNSQHYNINSSSSTSSSKIIFIPYRTSTRKIIVIIFYRFCKRWMKIIIINFYWKPLKRNVFGSRLQRFQ